MIQSMSRKLCTADNGSYFICCFPSVQQSLGQPGGMPGPNIFLNFFWRDMNGPLGDDWDEGFLQGSGLFKVLSLSCL